MKKVTTLCATTLLLVAVTATIGKAAELTVLGSPTPRLDALAYDAISETVLWSFGATADDGIRPYAGLIADKWGNLYGTTTLGGVGVGAGFFFSPGGGTVFELRPPIGKQTQWTEDLLWNFGVNSDDGQNPYGADLIADKWGNLYGTTYNGGANGWGTVFELRPPAGQSKQWSERVLWSFGATSDDGENPQATLIADKWGNLYGTTSSGGANGVSFGGFGTAFELSPPAGKSTQWSERVLWSFGSTGDGDGPIAGLLADKWGNLYGTSFSGGVNNGGTVFELISPVGRSNSWTESVLWSFGVTNDDGQNPAAGLIADDGGNLYGTTYSGGANCDLGLGGCGTAFELSPPTGKQKQWTERVLWNFPSASGDGFVLYAGLIADKLGNLYGTTSSGGANCPPFGCGTVFELTPPVGKSSKPWSESVLWSFDGDNGNDPVFAGLIADQRGNLYGTTALGGANENGPGLGLGVGTVFELSVPGWGQ